MITKKTIQEIVDTAKIEDVVQDFVALKRRGANMLGLCPFHNEKTPSFTVSPSKNIYKCFGCGKGGDPVSFIMEHESVSYPEALRYLANKYNIESKSTKRPKPTKRSNKNWIAFTSSMILPKTTTTTSCSKQTLAKVWR